MGVAEFEGLEFSLLCGCAPDSCKYLIKNDFIREIQVQGEKRIVGPGGILLNDHLTQGGKPRNFSEFPILHMFYVQGFAFKNIYGYKPKLIGKQEIIDSQLSYLFTGSYGIVDSDELRKLELKDDYIKDLLNQKLFFSGGHFRGFETLLDTFDLQDARIEIYPSIFIERIGPNYFKLTYKGDECYVDINMDEDELFEPLLKFEEKQLPSAKFSVVNTGCGDGWDPFRPEFGGMIGFQHDYFLVDAGAYIRHYISTLGVTEENLKGVFMTHVHDDHFVGLMDFLSFKKKLKIFSTRLVHLSIKAKFEALTHGLCGQYEDVFQIEIVPYDEWKDFNGLEVMALHTAHPVENAMFMFRMKDKDEYKSYAHFGDLASFDILERMGQTDDEGRMSIEFLEKIKTDYLREADIKKIDIGGGMIHGHAKDFLHDKSKKMILGHTSRPLNKEELIIGNAEEFGHCNILIS